MHSFYSAGGKITPEAALVVGGGYPVIPVGTEFRAVGLTGRHWVAAAVVIGWHAIGAPVTAKQIADIVPPGPLTQGVGKIEEILAMFVACPASFAVRPVDFRVKVIGEVVTRRGVVPLGPDGPADPAFEKGILQAASLTDIEAAFGRWFFDRRENARRCADRVDLSGWL